MLKQTEISNLSDRDNYYQTELLDLNNRNNYRFILDILFHCEKPLPLITAYCYYQEFGPKEKFEEAKNALEKALEENPSHIEDYVKRPCIITSLTNH